MFGHVGYTVYAERLNAKYSTNMVGQQFKNGPQNKYRTV